MPTARVPIPATTTFGGATPPTAGIRLRRLSGREVPMWLDEQRTAGPLYYGQAQQELWADTGLYELLVQPNPPSGPVYTSEVQVGTGTTVVTDSDSISYADLEAVLAAERAALSARFTANTEPEVISGAWNFTTAPTVGGQPIGTGGGTGDVTDAELTAALLTERTTSDERYAGVTTPETISGLWDFTTAPTLNGLPFGAGGGDGGGELGANTRGTLSNPCTDVAENRPTGLSRVVWDTPTRPAQWQEQDLNLVFHGTL